MSVTLGNITFGAPQEMTLDDPTKPRVPTTPAPARVTPPAGISLGGMTFGGGAAPAAPGRAARPGQSVQDLVARIAEQNDVPVPIALAVAQHESGFNQNARGGSGEIGVMQLMPGTAKALGVDPNDLERNILGGVLKLKQLYQKYGRWDRAFMAYNGGEEPVDHPERYQNPIGRQTLQQIQTYANKVLAQAVRFMRDPRYRQQVGQAVSRTAGELVSPVGRQAAVSGLTFGAVPMPRTTTPEQGVAAAVGSMVGQSPWWVLADMLLPGIGVTAPFAKAIMAGGAVGTVQGAAEVARGEATPLQGAETAAGYAAMGGGGYAVLATAGRVIRALASRVGKPADTVAKDVADIMAHDQAPGTPQEKLSRAIVVYQQDPSHRMDFSGGPQVAATRGTVDPENIAGAEFGPSAAMGPTELVPAGPGAGFIPEPTPRAAGPGVRVTPAPDPVDELRRSSELLRRIEALARRGVPQEVQGQFRAVREPGTGPLVRSIVDEARQRGVGVAVVIGEREARAGITPPRPIRPLEPGAVRAPEQRLLPSPTAEARKYWTTTIGPEGDAVATSPALGQRLQRVASETGIAPSELANVAKRVSEQYRVPINVAITAIEEQQGLVPEGTVRSVMDATRAAPAAPEAEAAPAPAEGPPVDPALLSRAEALVRERGYASTSLIQRMLKIPYAQAVRITRELERRGVIGPARGSQPREVFPPAGERPVGGEQPAAAAPTAEAPTVQFATRAPRRGSRAPKEVSIPGRFSLAGPAGDILRASTLREGNQFRLVITNPDYSLTQQKVAGGMNLVVSAARKIAEAMARPVQIIRLSPEGDTKLMDVLPTRGAAEAPSMPQGGAQEPGSVPSGVAVPVPEIMQAELLAQRASQEAPAYLLQQIESQIREMQKFRGEASRTAATRERKADAMRGRNVRYEKKRQAERWSGLGKLNVEAWDEYIAGLQAMKEGIQQDGLTLPPLPTEMPTAGEIRSAIADGDEAYTKEALAQMERAQDQLADAWRVLGQYGFEHQRSDFLPGGHLDVGDVIGARAEAPKWIDKDVNMPPSLRRYLTHLNDLTHMVNDAVRQADEQKLAVPQSLLDKLKRLIGTSNLGIVGPGTQMFMEMLDRGGTLAEVLDAGTRWGRALFVPMQNFLRRLPTGAEFVGRLDGAERQISQRFGQIESKIRAFSKLPLAERQNVRDMLQRHVAPMNDRTAEWAKFWTSYLADRDRELRQLHFWTYDLSVMDRIKDLNARIREGYKPSPDEKALLDNVFSGYRKYATRRNYWPAWVRKDIDASEEGKKRILRILTDKYMRERGATDDELRVARGRTREMAEAMAKFDVESIFRHKNVRYGNVEIARMAEKIPDEFREAPDREMTRYIMQVERAIALAKYFGSHAPVRVRGGRVRLVYEDSEALFSRIDEEATQRGMPLLRSGRSEAGGYAESAFSQYAGEDVLNDLDQSLRQGANTLNQLAIIGSMAISSVWKITQPFTNLPIRTSWTAFAGGMLDFWRNPNAAFREAMQSGALLNDSMYELLHSPDVIPMRGWARKFLTANLFIPSVQFSRAVAAATGRRWARSMLGRLIRNPNDRYAMGELLRIYGTRERVENMVREGGMSLQDSRDAGFEVSKDVEFLGRSDRYPEFWNSPWGQFAAMFHRFTMQQTQFLAHEWRIRTPAQKMKLIATTVPAWFAIGDIAQTIHENLSGRKRPLLMNQLYDSLILGKPMDQSGWELAKSITEATGGWAVLGFWYAIASTMSNPNRAEQLLGGPVPAETVFMGSQAVQAGMQEFDVQRGLRSPERRTALEALMRSLVRHVPFHGQLGLDTQFETPHARYIQMHQAAIAAWDRGDLGSFLSLNEQLMDSRPVTYAELSEHERKKAEKESAADFGEPAQQPLPGESNYVPRR